MSEQITNIIAGALDIFTRGPKGGKLKKARWNNWTIHDDSEDTYCSLGALQESARKQKIPVSYCRTAENLVASCVPKSYEITRGNMIPDWNDSLSANGGFASVKRVFCKALKKSMGMRTKRG